MSIQPPDSPGDHPYQPQAPQQGGPKGANPGEEFSKLMSTTPNADPSPTDAIPTYNQPDANATLQRAPDIKYDENQPNGLPNAQYYFHFSAGDIMSPDPYSDNPPTPDGYLLYPGASFSKQKDTDGSEVGVVTLPTPYDDPHNPSAKYYNWNYMYVQQGSSGAWQYCGSGPSLRINEIPMDYGLWQKYFPWEMEQFIMKPMENQFQQQNQQMESNRKRREETYKDEG